MFLNRFTRQVIAIATAFNISQSAFAAANMCQYVFTGPQVQSRPIDFGLNRTAVDALKYTPVELIEYKDTKLKLQSALAKVDPQKKISIEHLLSAVEFFDYIHTAKKLIPNFLDGKHETFDFTNLYDNGEAEGAPFKGFLEARNYLKTVRPEVSPSLLSELHKQVMANGVEGVNEAQLGKWRDAHWVGNAVHPFRITPKEVDVIEANPYLFFEENNRGPGNLDEVIWKNVKIWGSYKNMSLAPKDSTLVSGRIHYPFVMTPKVETVELIRNSHPEIYNEILAYRKANGGSNPKGKAPSDLEQRFTKALTEERFARFSLEKAALGKIKIGVNENTYIDIVADLQRDLVAIHPLSNGNGRTTRLMMNYLLTKSGLPPVRLVDPYLDVQVSKEEWREYVHKGVVNNAQLYADVLFRVQNGLTVEYSPELIYPGLPETVVVALKKQGSTKSVENYMQVKVDSEQFNAFIKTLVEMHPELRQQIRIDLLRAMSRMADLFVEYYRSKHIEYIHNKDGERLIALELVDPDFTALFGKNQSGNKELWDAKINRWYDRNMLVWRGLSNKYHETSTQELLNYFNVPTSHLVSNHVLSNMQEQTLLDAIKEDFQTYNHESISADVVNMANDHHKTGPRYGMSYGYSTSKREVVGKAFAMGAMVIAEYGKQNDPALQTQLKSRINVASFRALKDVDLGRLKAFDPEFSYIYGRQAEVMGIGGTDPDAVALVQRLDAKGNVIETFFRNFDKPNEILLIEGRFVPGEDPIPMNKIKQRFTLE